MIIYLYILREHLAPFIYSFLVITFILIMDFITQLLKLVMDKGLKLPVVLELFLLNLAWILALSIPMAVLVACLMAFGRLSQDNEIIAIKASGISFYKIIMPVFFAAFILCILMIYFNNYILPVANHRAANLYADISRVKPLAFMDEGMLIDDFPGYKILIKKMDVKTGMMYDIKIYEDEKGGTLSTTFAKRAHIRYVENRKMFKFELIDGEIHEPDPEKKVNYFRIKFERQVLYINNPADSLKRTERQYRSDREMSAMEMLVEINKHKGEKDNTISKIKDDIKLNFTETETLDKLAETDDSGRIALSWGSSPQNLIRNVKAKHQTTMQQLNRLERILDAKDRFISKHMVEVHKKYSIPVACIVFVLIGAPLGIMGQSGGISVGVAYSLFFFVVYWIFLIGGEILADKLIINPGIAMWSPNILIGLIGIFIILKVGREITFFQYEKLKSIFSYAAGLFNRINLNSTETSHGRLLKILSKYVLTRFMVILFLITLGMLFIFVAVDFIGNMQNLIKGGFVDIIFYYVYYIPNIMVMIFPVNMLLATMFCIGLLAKNNEITAMQAAGINSAKILAPVLITGLLVSLFILLFGETVLPLANELKLKTRMEKIEKRMIFNADRRRNFIYNGQDGIVYHFNDYLLTEKCGKGVSLQFFRENMKEVVECSKMIWKDDGWIFVDGVTRIHEKEATKSVPFDTLRTLKSMIHEKPSDFIIKKAKPEEMNFMQLKKHIENSRRAGTDFKRWLVDLHMKLSVPFINFIVVLLGAAITFRIGRRGIATVFGVGIIITFTYFTIVKIGQVLGHNSPRINPFLAAWAGNIIFFPVALILYWRNTR
ncbi:MAG: LptF/LptG family permease [bacterium]